MIVFVVSKEWNSPDGNGDPPVVGVRSSRASAEQLAMETRKALEEDSHQTVWEYTNRDGRHCCSCGYDFNKQTEHECPNPNADEFCDHCGAELTEGGSCDNMHTEWDVDVHVSEHEVLD